MARTAHVPRRLQHVPFRGSEAVAEGLLTRRMINGRAWRRMLPDVYVHADIELDHRAWCAAVTLTLPLGAAVGGLSAAYLWGVDLLARGAAVTVVSPRKRRLQRHPMTVVHYTTFGEGDLTTFAGMPVTTPERTAFDLGRRLTRADALAALDAMLHRRSVTPAAITALAATRRRWPGGRQLSELLTLAEPLAESPMETKLRLLFADAGLPPPVAQFAVRDDAGRFLGRVDLAWPALRLAVEYEGDHHRERRQFRRDITRLNHLRAAGWTVLRFTADDVLRRPEQTVRAVAVLLRTPPDPTARQWTAPVSGRSGGSR